MLSCISTACHVRVELVVAYPPDTAAACGAPDRLSVLVGLHVLGRGSHRYMSAVSFDLGLAMRKKEEFESARLMDFEFRLRARAARLLASSLGLDQAAVSSLVASVPETELLERLAQLASASAEVIRPEYQQCVAEARVQLVAERGDPTPNRLA